MAPWAPWALPDPDPKDWAMAGTYSLVFSQKTDFLTPDLANYGPDGNQDHLFAAPCYIDISPGELTISHLTPIS